MCCHNKDKHEHEHSHDACTHNHDGHEHTHEAGAHSHEHTHGDGHHQHEHQCCHWRKATGPLTIKPRRPYPVWTPERAFVAFPFSFLTISVLKSSSGGTGFPACADRQAGAEARPTNIFMLCGWAEGPWGTVLKSSLNWWHRRPACACVGCALPPLAGNARPTYLFIICGWAKGPWMIVWKIFAWAFCNQKPSLLIIFQNKLTAFIKIICQTR